MNMALNNLLEIQGVIHSDPEIMSGVPVFKGTRVPLKTLFDYLEGDGGLAEFIDDFPYLKTQIKIIGDIVEPTSKALVS